MKQAAFIIIVLLLAAIMYYIFTLPPREMSIKDLHPVLVPHSNQNEAIPEDTIPAAGSETTTDKVADTPDTHDVKVDIDKSGTDFFIIIGSFKSLSIAREKADKLGKDLHAGILVLPVAANGYYRISYGKYSTFEEARSSLNSVKMKIKPDAWIFTVQNKNIGGKKKAL